MWALRYALSEIAATLTRLSTLILRRATRIFSPWGRLDMPVFEISFWEGNQEFSCAAAASDFSLTLIGRPAS